MVHKITKYNEWYCFYFLFDMEIINGHMWKVYLIIFSCNIYITVCVVYEIFYSPVFNFYTLYVVFREPQRAVQVHSGAKRNLLVKVNLYFFLLYKVFF